MSISGSHIPRDFLSNAGSGLGALLWRDAERGRVRGNHSRSLTSQAAALQANREILIWLFMEGGPSHVDLFDPKPR